MKEKEFIQIIKSTLNSDYIGDDCAYLKDLGIVITQDSLVEDIHFKMDYITPYQLGYKSVMVNISDICASGAEPKYLTISLSLPKNIDKYFIKDFYDGCKQACQNVEIVGGDITGSDKIFISVTAIGSTKGRKISSRSNAKIGYKVIVSGEHGNSAKGLEILQSNLDLTEIKSEKFINAHLMPVAQRDFSTQIATNINCDYAMMDTSDGLADALMQIAKASSVTLCVDTSRIPHDLDVELDKVLYGGEDYQLIAVVPEDILKKISNYTIIGEAIKGIGGIKIDEEFYSDIDNLIFNHFEEKNEQKS
jgi:thiamine-monophosphate kinase